MIDSAEGMHAALLCPVTPTGSRLDIYPAFVLLSGAGISPAIPEKFRMTVLLRIWAGIFEWLLRIML